MFLLSIVVVAVTVVVVVVVFIITVLSMNSRSVQALFPYLLPPCDWAVFDKISKPKYSISSRVNYVHVDVRVCL